jgi:hypothetical protein
MTVTGAGPDAALLTQFDMILIRFLLAVLSLRFGDFLRLEPEGETAVRVSRKIRSTASRLGKVMMKTGRLKMTTLKKFIESDHDRHWIQRWLQGLLDRLPAAFPFLLCHLMLLMGTMQANSMRCANASMLLLVSFSGFITIMTMSFFAFLPQLNWMMRSPMVQQIQMMAMHRYKAPTPPPYVYISDGGLLEVLGLLPLLRRRLRYIIVSDAAEDAKLTMRCLRETSTNARKEFLCSFFDPKDPRRDLEFVWEDLVRNQQSFLHLCVRYEPLRDTEGNVLPPGPDDVEIGHVFYIRMRGNPDDASPVRSLLTEAELLRPPAPVSAEQVQAGYGLRRDFGGTCFPQCECGGRCVGRRFPDFSHPNQFLTPLHFANLCTLGAELAAPAVEALQSVTRSAA